jgi:hypothetical protein
MLLDDGELDTVLEVLEEMDVPFVHLQGQQIRRRVRCPRSLLLTTARRAIKMPQLADLVRGPRGPLWIAFHNQDFLPFRKRLGALGVHFLVQTSVNPDALRLLLEYVLYRGSEKRDDLRLPTGSGITYEIDGTIRRGTLLELSAHGCRLRGSDRPKRGTPITIHLPAQLGGGRVLSLPGETVRVICSKDVAGEPETLIAVTFEAMEKDVERQVAKILEGGAIGTLVTPLERAGAVPLGNGSSKSATGPQRVPASAPSGTRDRRPAPPGERRADQGAAAVDRRVGRRAVYAHGVTASLSTGTHVLLGRDLSLEGIRVDGHPSLQVGATVRLALYGGPPRRPLIVAATVAREDDGASIALRFGHLGPQELDALERIIAGLPSVESLAGGEGVSGPVVVSRIVGHEAD